jgi:hypothetical protein
VQGGRRADIDHIDVVHGEERGKIRSAARHCELVADLGEARGIDIAQRQHPEFVGVTGIALGQMAAADAAADHGNVENR